jgi:predicted DNA-binding transcriptional regulator YafY
MNRQFEILYILLNKRTSTARELAERFGVSMRTIYRDVDTLGLAGIPVCTEQGKGGGISLMPEFVLSRSILSEAEQTEILSALQGLSGVKAAETDHVLQKLSSVFNRNTVRWLEVDFSDWGCQGGQVFQDFKTAILEKRIAEFDYYNTYGEAARRRVEPIQLWFKSRAWYLKGFCLNRQGVRLFKLTRIRNLRVTDELFSARNLLEGASIPDTRRQRDVTLKLKIAPEMAYRVYDEFAGEETERLPDGSFLVTVTWPEDNWVYGTVLSFGEHAEVLEPAHIRETILEKARKIAEKY